MWQRTSVVFPAMLDHTVMSKLAKIPKLFKLGIG